MKMVTDLLLGHTCGFSFPIIMERYNYVLKYFKTFKQIYVKILR